MVHSDGTRAKPITESEFSAVWSPDGRWIAIDQASEGSQDLFIVHPDGSGLTQMTHAADGSFSFGPAWSPDGQWLLFVRGTGEGFSNTELFIEKVDGTGLMQLTNDPAQYGWYGWSPVSIGS